MRAGNSGQPHGDSTRESFAQTKDVGLDTLRDRIEAEFEPGLADIRVPFCLGDGPCDAGDQFFPHARTRVFKSDNGPDDARERPFSRSGFFKQPIDPPLDCKLDLDELPHPVLGYALLEPPSGSRVLASQALPANRVRRYSPLSSLIMTFGCKFACQYCPLVTSRHVSQPSP